MQGDIVAAAYETIRSTRGRVHLIRAREPRNLRSGSLPILVKYDFRGGRAGARDTYRSNFDQPVQSSYASGRLDLDRGGRVLNHQLQVLGRRSA